MSPDPLNLWFSFPLHVVDDAHILDGAAVEGSREANLAKSPNRTSSFERKRILDESFESVVRADGMAKFSDMYNSPVCPVTHKTLRGYLKEFADEYTCEDGYVRRNS